MTSATLWLEITIAGSPLLAAAFFVTFSITGVKDLSKFGVPADYLPYLSVVFVIASFLTGIVTLRLGQILMFMLSGKSLSGRSKVGSTVRREPSEPQYGVNAYEDLVTVWQKGSERLCAELDRQYSLLALLVSLVASTPILGVSVSIWLMRSDRTFIWLPLLTSALIVVALLIACKQQWRFYINLRTAAVAEVRG